MESEQRDEQSSTGHTQDEKGRECWSVKRWNRADAQEEKEVSLKSNHKFPPPGAGVGRKDGKFALVEAFHFQLS